MQPQLAAFYWRDGYKDVHRSGPGEGSKRFAWDKAR